MESTWSTFLMCTSHISWVLCAPWWVSFRNSQKLRRFPGCGTEWVTWLVLHAHCYNQEWRSGEGEPLQLKPFYTVRLSSLVVLRWTYKEQPKNKNIMGMDRACSTLSGDWMSSQPHLQSELLSGFPALHKSEHLTPAWGQVSFKKSMAEALCMARRD